MSPNKFHLIYSDSETDLWFKPDSVVISEESSDTLILESWIRIDYKELKATEIAFWYFSTEREKIKKTHTYVYDEQGYSLDA